MIKLTKQDLLSTLWIFTLINVLFADIFGFMLPGSLAEVMSGNVDGINITVFFMFIAAIVNEIPIIMVVLSKILKRKVNRILNIVIGIFTIVYIVGGGSGNIVYYFFATVEVLTLLSIITIAYKWKED
ncbi:MAG: hypothetical protein JEZ08_06110 [Clostridiales bacterium]|nr:hypothetical protein [Clostridiales bacterium]